MTDIKAKKSSRRNPSCSSLLNSEKTRDTIFSYRENPTIHALFQKPCPIEPKKIRSSSFCAQIKSLFIKNLVPKPKILTKRTAKSPIEFQSPQKTASVYVLPTSDELNEKFLKIRSSEQQIKKQKSKNSENHHRIRSQCFSSKNYISFNSPTSIPHQKPIFCNIIPNISFLNINSNLVSPKSHRSIFDNKSQKSVPSFENGSSSSRKRKTSICKTKNTVLFRFNNNNGNRNEEENEIVNFGNINVLQRNLAKGEKNNFFNYKILKLKIRKETSLDVLKFCFKKTAEIEKDARRVTEKFDKITKEEEDEEAFKLKSTDQNDFIRGFIFYINKLLNRNPKQNSVLPETEFGFDA